MNHYMVYRETDNEQVQYERDLSEAKSKDIRAKDAELVAEINTAAQSFTDVPMADDVSRETKPKETGVNEAVNEAINKVTAPLRGNPAIQAFLKMPKYITRGTLEAVQNLQSTIFGDQENVNKVGAFLEEEVPGYKELNGALNSLYQKVAPEGQLDKTMTEVAQFGGPFLGALKLIGGFEKGVSTLKLSGKAFAADFVASFSAMNPEMERFAGLAQEFGFENEWINYLTSRGGSEYEERLKNAIDSSTAGAVIGPVLFFGGKMIKSLYQAANKGGQKAFTTSEKALPIDESSLKQNIAPNEVDIPLSKPVPDENLDKQNFISSQSETKDLDKALANAGEAQAEIVQASEKIADEMGLKFKKPGVKGKEGAAQKVADGKKVEELTDLARSGFKVKTVKESADVVEKLKKDFDVLDEGITFTPVGYFDRKAFVRAKNGTIAEFQLWEPNLLNAKDGGGHDLYGLWREVTYRGGAKKGQPKKGKEAAALFLQKNMFNLYLGAAKKAGKDWQELYIKNLNEEILEQIGLTVSQVTKALKSSSDISEPLVNASIPSNLDQLLESLSKAKPSKGEPSLTATKTAGRPSKDIGLTILESGEKGKSPGNSIKPSKGKK